MRTFLRQDCSSVESENRWFIGKVAESIDAWNCARDGTKHQISSQAVECVAKVDFRLLLLVLLLFLVPQVSPIPRAWNEKLMQKSKVSNRH